MKLEIGIRKISYKDVQILVIQYEWNKIILEFTIEFIDRRQWVGIIAMQKKIFREIGAKLKLDSIESR